MKYHRSLLPLLALALSLTAGAQSKTPATMNHSAAAPAAAPTEAQKSFTLLKRRVGHITATNCNPSLES